MNFNEIYELAQAIKKLYPNTLESIIQNSSNTTLYQDKKREPQKAYETQEASNKKHWEKITHNFGEYNLEVHVHSCECEAVQKTIQSLIHFADQVAAHKTRKYVKPSVNLLTNYLFHAKSPEVLANASLLASEMGYNLEESRVLCLFDFDESAENLTLFDRYNKNLILCISNNIPNPQQSIVSNYGNHQLVLCAPVPQNSFILKPYLDEILIRVLKKIKSQFGLECTVGVSSLIQSASGFNEALSCAQAALRYRILFDANRIAYIENFYLDYCIEAIPQEILERYLEPYVTIIEGNPDLFKTIEALLFHELSFSEAAKDLYIHKNTMVNRVSFLKSALRMDPIGSDSDCFLLYMIYHYLLLRKNKHSAALHRGK